MDYLKTTVFEPIWRNLVTYNGDLFQKLLIAFGVVLAGFIAGKIVQLLLKLLLKVTFFDTLCDKTRLTQLLEKAGMRNIPSNSVANFFFWVILLASFVAAVDLVSIVSSFQILQRILAFIPMALLAIFIIILGTVIGLFFARIFRTFAINSGVSTFLSTVLEKAFLVLFVAFSVKLALNVLRIDDRIILVVVDNFFKFAFLGLAIAFGLGARSFAEDFVAWFKIRSVFPKGTEILLEGQKAIVKEIYVFHTLLYTENGIFDMPNAALSRRLIKKIN
jgi:hypothetical protein